MTSFREKEVIINLNYPPSTHLVGKHCSIFTEEER